MPDEPELDCGSEFTFDAFMKLNAQRKSGFSGAEPLSYGEVESFMRTTHTPLWPEEVEAIMAMDSAYRQAVEKIRNREKSKETK